MPEIVVLLEGQEVQRVAFGREPITIGRSDENAVAVEDMSISRRHARIDQEEGHFFLSDLASANGTTVNGRSVTRTRIFHSDLIGVGRHHLLLLAPEAQPESVAPPEEADAAADETMVLPQATGEAYLTLRPARRAGSVVALPLPSATVGRAADCDVRVVDWFVEPVQARIEQDGPFFLLHPAGTPERVRLNGSPLAAPAHLRSGDVIEMGLTRLIFALDAAEADAARQRPLADFQPVAAQAARAEWEADLAEEIAAAPGEDLEALVFDDVAEVPGELPEKTTPEAPHIDLEPAWGTSAEVPEGAAVEAVGEKAIEAPRTELEGAASEELSEKDRKALAMWERALQNPSPMVRKQAAEQIRRLTGRDYV